MENQWSDDEGYPDERTRRILKWCERVDEITNDDRETLPRMLNESDAETLLDVYGHYDSLYEDAVKCGEVFSEWDQTVWSGIRGELRNRGVVVVSEELAQVFDPILSKIRGSEPHH